MLQNMHIKNIALIDEIDVNFEEGLNILTGETGAGKSIIIGSLGICLGGKFNKELLRDENSEGLIELFFTVDNDRVADELNRLGIDVSDGELLLSRKLGSNGKTVTRINGETATTSLLKQVSSILIDLHAQHEQQTLLKEDKHLQILDRFGGEEIQHIKEKVKDNYNKYVTLRDELDKTSMDETERNKQLDYLKYQIEEIELANLKKDEDIELESFYRKAANSKEIISVADSIYQLTGGSSIQSAAEQIGHSVMQMKRLVELDEDLAGSYELIQNVDDILGDFNRELKSYIKSMEFDDQEFEQAEARLNQINSLKAKYGNTIEDILNSKKEFEEEYNRLVRYDEYVEELKKKLAIAETDLRTSCEKLSKTRKKYSKKLCTVIKNSMEELNFMAVQFDMRFDTLDKYTSNGTDEACFMISPNVGEPMRPLQDIASGGELSRVMLAIKSCLATEDDTPTLVFDEIDVGISGRTAQSVAEKLYLIGREHQVICITHLPQIAAMSDSHYLIEKIVENNKTITNISKLKREAQITEIARLLGGAKITEATIKSAEDMKGLASKTKLY